MRFFHASVPTIVSLRFVHSDLLRHTVMYACHSVRRCSDSCTACSCPADEPLTEECFERTPVPFEGADTIIRLKSGKESTVKATFLSKGTHPPGSTWKMNPVPECCPGASDTAAGACEQEGYTCGSYTKDETGRKCGAHTCGHDSGMGKSVPAFPWPTEDPSAPPTGVEPKFAIVDRLRLPEDLKPGHWVLGWR